MRTCWLCRNETELDDIVLSLANGSCICLRCYGRETDSTPAMPVSLRHAVRAVLARAEREPAAHAVAEDSLQPASQAVRSDASAGTTDSDWPSPWWETWGEA